MLRPGTLVAALAICLLATPADSTAGLGHRRGRHHPCPPCLGAKTYYLWFSDHGHWTRQSSSNTTYHSLYLEGRAAQPPRKFRHHSEGCHHGYDTTEFFTIATDQPPDVGTPATTYYCCKCDAGVWSPCGECPNPSCQSCPECLIDDGIAQGWKLMECSEPCGGYREITFTVCPASISPCSPGRGGCGCGCGGAGGR